MTNNLIISQDILFILNILGSIAFMISGSLAGIKKHMDIGGIIFLAIITGIGGGTVRDILLGVPVFWINQNWYIYLAITIGLILFIFYKNIQPHLEYKFFNYWLNFFDALGLVPFMIAGVTIAQGYNHTDLVCVLFGLTTCIGGGVLRDALCNEIPIVFRDQLYATPVIFGAIIYLGLAPFGQILAIAISGSFIAGVRIITIIYRLKLPSISV